MTETETKNISIEHIAKLTKSNDIVTITKADGNVTIDTSENKGSDVLKFDNTNYSSDKFSTAKDGQDLKLIYTDGTEQTITIKNYFSKDGNSTKSSVKEIQIGDEKKSILDYYTNTVSAKSTKINGSMFNDIITGTDKADKISTGAGDDVITAGKGNDTINITGAGEKTIKIKDFDGDDVISGIAKADKVKLNFSSVDTTVDYSKSGNNLVATREFYKKLDGTATTDAKSTEHAKQMYVDKDGKLTTEAEGNKAITGNLYQSADGKYSITKDDTFTSQVYLDKDGKLTTETKTGEVNNTVVNKLYEKDTNYTMSETYEHTNESVKETTTIKDYFKNDKNAGKLDGVTNVAVSGKGKIVGGFTNDTITGSAKNDKMYGLGGNNTYIFNSDAKTKFGNDTVYSTGKDTLSFAAGSTQTYELKGNDVLVTVKGEKDAVLGTVTIKDALKSKKDVSISVGGVSQGTLENAIQSQLKFDQHEAKKGQKMNGTVFNDTFIGSDYNDKIYTGAGDDAITAGKGNDTIFIDGAGKKTITIANGDGNDVITGIAKAEKVTLSGLTEEKLSYAKSGNDLVITRIEKDAVAPTEKTEGTPAETATTTIKDYFKDSKNADKLAGVTVKDIAVTGKGKIVGTFGNDVITGSAKADKIYTGTGNDTINAGKGNDTIFIDGAGKKTINIANHDGNDVITGVRTEGASVDLTINETDKLSYSKNGASNDLIITRSYTEQLTNKKGDKLYTDVVTGRQTTETAVKGTEATGTFWQKDGNIITDDAHTKIGTDAQKGYTEATGEFWSKTEGGEIITKTAYDALTSKDDYKKVEEAVYSTKDSKGNVSYITKTAYDSLATDALNKSGYTQITDTKVYSYGSGKNLTYSTDATKANTALNKDYTETTTVKDFFKDGEGASNVKVNGEAIKLDGLTISGQNIMGTNYNDVIYGSNKNDVIMEQAGNNTFNISAKGSTVINSAGASSNDTYNVANLNTSVDIYDNGGKDTLNINVENMKAEDLHYAFDVDKNGAKGDLIITNAKGITSSKFNGVAINDYFTTQVSKEGGATETVDHKVETINLNGSSITDNVATSIANITNDVQNFLNANNYESASAVLDGKDRKAKAELKEIYNSGNNKYNFSTVEKNAEQTVTDKIGDSDIYNVDNKFDFAKDKLVISDSQGENDVLNLAQKADKLTILFDIKKSASEGESAVGDALYVIGKDSKDLAHGIQMSGIDKVKTADGDVVAPTNTDKIVSDVQSWLNSDANKGGYDSVADVIKNASTSGADLSGLISAYAPSTQTPQV